MTIRIRRAAVLGAGVMGAQIAAYLAAAGVRTHLLDLASEKPPTDKKLKSLIGSRYRSTRAIMALEQMRQMKPSPLVSETVIANIVPGNFSDDMAVLADVDWVIEAVAERPDIKRSIHQRVAEVVGGDTPITTNTSGISVGEMAKNFPEHLAKNFFGTHFFNPPRYLHLVEVIAHDASNGAMIEALSDWIARNLGKGIVKANDTTNFIANRIGVYNLQVTLKHMDDLGLNLETVDALTGKLMGRPASATFRTLDIVGLDTFAHTSSNVHKDAADDPQRDVFRPTPWLQKLVDQGALGAKTNNTGCYKKTRNTEGKTEILAYRPQSQTYETQSVQEFPWMKDASRISDTMERLRFILAQSDAGAQLVWRTLRDTMAYAASTVIEIANGDPQAVDEAIRWGFNWQWGPFELWQGIGYLEILSRMKSDGTPLPDWLSDQVKFYSPTPGSQEWEMTGVTYKYDVERDTNRSVERKSIEFQLPKRSSSGDDRIIASNASASLLDIGNGVSCLTFHSKMNAIDEKIIELINTAVDRTTSEFCGMVIANEGEHFSAGANLAMLAKLIDKGDIKGVERIIQSFQAAMQRVKYASFPTVAAPFGMTLGGGLEVAMQTSAQIVAGETYAGLVEMGVGLIPAGGGTKELCLQAHAAVEGHDRPEPMPFIQAYFKLIGMAQVSTSGHEARQWGLLPKAHVSLSKPHLIARAKAQVLHMDALGYVPPTPVEQLQVVGDPGAQTIRLMLYNMQQAGYISEHDCFIAERVASILCGGPVDAGTMVSEGYLLTLERLAFLELCQHPKTQARIEHMLKTGKPLRN